MSRRYYSSSAADTTLSVSVTAGATSIVVGSITGHPVQYPYTLILDPGTPSEEIVEVTAGTGTTLTVTRGVDGTTALSHTTSAVVRHGVSARDFDEPNAHAAATSNVHGLSGGLESLGPTGGIQLWSTDSPPAGWLICDGSAVSRTTYAALFAVIGETYGTGNGSTTFTLPNLKGRIPVGRDTSQTEFDTLAETGGAKTHTLSTAEMPSHGHTQNAHGHTQDAHSHSAGSGGASADHAHSGSTGGQSADHSHATQTSDRGVATGGGTVAKQNQGVPGDGTYGASNDHSHSFTTGGHSADHSHAVTVNSATGTNQATTATNQATGGGGAHNNLQPYVVLNYIIKH